MSLGSGQYPPLVAHGPNDSGATVVVVTYSLMFITILFAMMRAWATRSHKRDTEWDDRAFFLAILPLIAQSILTERAVHYGLGRHIGNVVGSRLGQYYKYEYAAQILGIITRLAAKCAVVLMIGRIAEELSRTKLSLVLKTVIGVWAIFSIFTIAFQCGVPRPWKVIHDKCAAHGKLYYVIIAGDIATDAVLACYIIPTFLKLQMSRHKKIVASSLFLTRLVVCVVSIGYIALIPGYLSSNDTTWRNVNVQILNQLALNLSVITAGLPGVRKYLSEMQTGRLAVALDSSQIEMTTRGSKSKGANGSKMRSEQDSSQVNSGQSTQEIQMRPDRTARYTTRITGGARERYGNETKGDVDGAPVNDEDITGDDKSTSSLVKNGVFQKRDVEVRIEYDE